MYEVTRAKGKLPSGVEDLFIVTTAAGPVRVAFYDETYSTEDGQLIAETLDEMIATLRRRDAKGAA